MLQIPVSRAAVASPHQQGDGGFASATGMGSAPCGLQQVHSGILQAWGAGPGKVVWGWQEAWVSAMLAGPMTGSTGVAFFAGYWRANTQAAGQARSPAQGWHMAPTKSCADL